MMSANPELQAINMINKLVPLLDYLELSALEIAIGARRYSMRQEASNQFKSIGEPK